MQVFYSPAHKKHDPPFEGFTQEQNLPALEVPERAERVVSALRRTGWTQITSPTNFDLEPVLAVHSPRYLDYLRSAYHNWKNFSPVPGMAFIPGTYGISHDKVQSGEVSEDAGFFLMDTTVGITAKTFAAALEAVNCSLSAAQVTLQGLPSFALCRPPGHHAGREICGGYCYLNNAAIAAQWLADSGKVAILDVDYHAGNGTQEIFYDREDVLTVSLHADPSREYPRFAGFASETGAGDGKGYHLNFPLPAGIDDAAYLEVLAQALDTIKAFSADFLVISVGMDIYQEDPLGDFALTRQGIFDIGNQIAGLKCPSLVVMEGGYHLPSLGDNFVAFLTPFATQ